MRLNPYFKCDSNFVLSWVDKVTTGTSTFVSVIAKVVALYALKMTQFSYEVRVRLISQFIKGISRVLQKLSSNLMAHLLPHQ